MHVAIYVRVSTRLQTQTQTIDQQIERLKAHIAAQGWPLLASAIFRDDGSSGASLRRPGLDRLRDHVAAAQCDTILVTDPDRLARTYVHQVLLREELQQHGCHVEFLDRPMSQDPHDQLLLQIRGAVAEYERSLIAERTRRGRLRKLQNGQMLPWTRPPYGYRVNPDHPRDPAGVRVDPAEAALVAHMFAWYIQDSHSLLGLVKHLAETGAPSPTGKPHWGVASVRGILTNPTYTWTIYVGRMRYRPPHIRRSATHPIGRPRQTGMPVAPQEWVPAATVPAIITAEQFQLTQAKLATHQSFARRHNKVEPYLLRALVSCGQCGLACMARKVQPHNTYYICTGKCWQVRQRTGAHCSSRFIPARQLDELVWNDLCDLLRHPQIIAQALERAHAGHWLPQELQARRENLCRGQGSLQQQLERLTEAYLNGVIPLPEYQRRRMDLEQRQAALMRQEEQLHQQAQRLHEAAGLASSVEAFCQRVQTGLGTATFARKRQLVELLIDRVIVTGDDVEIRYVIPTSQRSEHLRFCHLRLDYFCTPNLVDTGNRHAPQQIGIDPVNRMRLTQPRLGINCF
jgi:site-specific DNA recombinase